MKLLKIILQFFIMLWTGKTVSQQEPPKTQPVKIYPHVLSEFDLKIINEINESRRINGVPMFLFKQELTNVAASHCKWMLNNQTVGHDYFEERAARFPNHALGEVIAFGFKNEKSTISAWLNSPSHRKSMLNPKYFYVGVATVFDSQNRAYVTALFLTK